ncbi:hypothetical protein SAMN02745248_00731 [Hathewaya proteolytica DSM 3090]|uniref:Uncharacterized protein n=1 Tax=Hathewaya proteolytica DSM 3090 TaxID=1121331 RepID=A0A1M6LEN7_9CLOT|nr:hypothetical protein [Hathewaya proteolytica]SHJ69622.1 hypothetical protein SAMN02745248_00731 [Hathewaya proteolytica DSM 3090]
MRKNIIYGKIAILKWFLDFTLKYFSHTNSMVVLLSKFLDKYIVKYQMIRYAEYKRRQSFSGFQLT